MKFFSSKVPGDVDNLCAKDAIYFSMHKFVGGVQTPGVLVAKKDLFKNNTAPYESGGGSVFFVTENDHKYLKETEIREEAGTPAIGESIVWEFCPQEGAWKIPVPKWSDQGDAHLKKNLLNFEKFKF